MGSELIQLLYKCCLTPRGYLDRGNLMIFFFKIIFTLLPYAYLKKLYLNVNKPLAERWVPLWENIKAKNFSYFIFQWTISNNLVSPPPWNKYLTKDKYFSELISRRPSCTENFPSQIFFWVVHFVFLKKHCCHGKTVSKCLYTWNKLWE